MRFQFTKATKVIFALMLAMIFAIPVAAQRQNNQGSAPSTVIYKGSKEKQMPVAMGNNLYCAGFIQKASMSTGVEVVGAENEKDQHLFAQGDALYVSSGSSNGVKVGDMFAVVRPRGRVKTKWTSKSSLGYYVQEVGAVEIVKVMSDVSVARVKTSCSVVLLGDLLQPVPQRTSPMYVQREALDRFGAPSGKASGRIVMARDNLELLGREQIVYIDLGNEDNVKVGDFLTIFRPLGTGNVYRKVQKESVDNKEEGFQSRRYHGGRFSNQSARKKGTEAGGKVVTSENAKSRRPAGLRRIVGELMILNVKESTATAVIVRNTSEIHTGDMVEVQ